MGTRNSKQNSNTAGGIVFVRSRDIARLKDFYIHKAGCSLWLDQGGCIILKHGNLLLGFCQAETAETEGVYTFFYGTREEVDSMYTVFSEDADGPPRENEKYRIYHFYARDPEGRSIEFQHFLHPLPAY